MYEGTSDAMLLELHDENRSRYVTINHFFVTLGYVAISLAFVLFYASWRVYLIGCSTVVILLGTFFALAPWEKNAGGRQRPWAQLAEVPQKSALALLFAATVLIVGAELGTVGYLTTYLEEVRGAAPGLAKIALLSFCGGIAAGRLLVGLVSQDVRVGNVVVGLLALSAGAFAVLYFLPQGELAVLAAFVTGMAISAICPLLIALTGIRRPGSAAPSIALLKIAIPVGGVVVPLAMSLLSKRVSLEASLAVFPLAALLGLLLVLAEKRLARHRARVQSRPV